MKNWMKSFGKFALAITAAVGTLSVASQVQAADLGNNSANIMNDGVIATYKGDTYYANMNDNGKLYVMKDGHETKLSDRSATDINVLNGVVYYLGDDEKSVRCLKNGSDRVVFKADAAIDELYVTSDNQFWYLSGGDVYVRNEDGETARAVDVSSNIIHFIPADQGVIYATGRTLNYTLYANGDQIRSNVSTFYDVDGTLYMNIGSVDYEAPISSLFNGKASAAVIECPIEETLDAAMLADDEQAEICEECEENAEHTASDAQVNDDWGVAEAGYDMLMEGEDSGLDASTATGVTSILNDSSVCEGQRNMVRRAYQQHLIAWTPKKDIYGWNKEYVYEKGKTYTGLPYGQPVSNGGYVPWSCSLEKFISAVNDSSSVMYTSYSSYNKRAPYYSTDCSGFVSWAWNNSGRLYTRIFANVSTKVSKQSIYSVQIGDAFCKAGSHVVMVSDIGYKSGSIVYIDIIEETPPLTKLTRYGTGGSKTLADLTAKYLDKGYILYRYNKRTSVKYTASSVVKLPNEEATTLSIVQSDVELAKGESKTLTIKTDGGETPSWSSSDSSVVSVTSGGVVKGLKVGKVTITCKVGKMTATTSVTVLPDVVALGTAVPLNENGIKITWTAISGATSYTIYRKVTDGSWTKLTTVDGDKSSYSDTSDLKANTTYYYSVSAGIKNASGTITSGAYNKTGISAKTTPAAPSLTSVEAVDTYDLKFTWAAATGAKGYEVLIKKDGAPEWTSLVETTGTSCTAKNLEKGSTYAFTVRAYILSGTTKVYGKHNATGKSKMVPFKKPALQSLTQSAYNAFTLTWDATEGVDGYDILVKYSTAKDWSVKGTVTDANTTSWTHTGLKIGGKYRYTVRPYRMINGKKVVGGYNTTGLMKYVIPQQPTLKTVTNVTATATEQKVTWKSVSGATGYYVYYRKATSTGWTKCATVKGKTSYTKKKLKKGTNYYFAVKAYTSLDGKTSISTIDKTGICLPIITAPAKPALKGVENVSATSQSVSWNGVACDGYNIYQRTSSTQEWTKVASASASAESVVITGLKTGTTYSYTVKAYMNGYGSKVMSEFDNTGVTLKLTKETSPETKLQIPDLNAATMAGKGSVELKWNKVSGATCYRIFRKTADTDWSIVGNVGDVAVWTDTTAKGIVEYIYTVAAGVTYEGSKVYGSYNTTGIKCNMVLDQPKLVSITSPESGKVRLIWANSDYADYYYVGYKNSSGEWTWLSKQVTANSVLIGNMATGKDYTLTVRAVWNFDGKEESSTYDTNGLTITVS